MATLWEKWSFNFINVRRRKMHNFSVNNSVAVSVLIIKCMKDNDEWQITDSLILNCNHIPCKKKIYKCSTTQAKF